MEFNAKNPDNAGKAVYMLYYRSPLSVGSFAKAGITKPADLNGKKIGGALTDGAYKLFPAYAKLASIKADSIQWQYGDLRLREALLLKGDVDAILGFDSTMYFNLGAAGHRAVRHQVSLLLGRRAEHLRQCDPGLEEAARIQSRRPCAASWPRPRRAGATRSPTRPPRSRR